MATLPGEDTAAYSIRDSPLATLPGEDTAAYSLRDAALATLPGEDTAADSIRDSAAEEVDALRPLLQRATAARVSTILASPGRQVRPLSSGGWRK